MLKASETSLGKIAELLGDSLNLHIFEIDNGWKAHAKRKVTIRRGLINTKYVHIIMVDPKGRTKQYREQPDGTYKLVGTGR